MTVRRDREWLLQQLHQRECDQSEARQLVQSCEPGPVVGDILLVKQAAEECPFWLILCSDDSENYFYVAPIDSSLQLGAEDANIPATILSGPFSVRAGCGIWVGRRQAEECSRVDMLTHDALVELTDRLRVNREELPDEVRDVEDSWFYREHMDGVRASRDAFVQWIQSEGSETDQQWISRDPPEFIPKSPSQRIRLSDFRRSWPPGLGAERSELRMAAESEGLVGGFIANLQEAAETAPCWHPIQGDFEGQLNVIVVPEGVRLAFVADRDDSAAPQLKVTSHEDRQPDWMRTEQHGQNLLMTDTIEWDSSDRVCLQLPGGPKVSLQR